MKTLADEILDVLPALTAQRPEGATVEDVANLLYVPAANARAAMKRLRDDGRALLVRYPGSKRRYLTALNHDFGPKRRACAHCGLVFAAQSKRRCCSRPCSIRWGWTRLDPDQREARTANAREGCRRPENRARITAQNLARFSDPVERENIAAHNRKRWADPVARAKNSASIQRVHGSPEYRKLYSDQRKAMWEDPEYRERCIAAMAAAKRTPEARARFSALLRERWQDPAWREKWARAVKANSEKGASKLRGTKQTPEQVAKRVAARKASMEARRAAGIPITRAKDSPETIAKRAASIRETNARKRMAAELGA